MTARPPLDAAEVYRQTWAHLCAGPVDTVLDDLGPATGGRLLDAGCGTGTVARAAATRGWTVAATDVDAPLLRVARTACDGLGVQWVRSALPRSGLRDGGFDAVVANFVVNNVTDPLACTRELARVVRPGGTVALTAWVSERTTHIAVIEEAFRSAGLPDPRQRRAAEVDFERTVDGLASLARRAGLAPLRLLQPTWDWTVSWDDLWLALVTALGRPYLDLDGPARDRLEQQVRERIRLHTGVLERGGRLRVPSVAAYVLARRAH